MNEQMTPKLYQQFWSRVTIDNTSDHPCWLWTGATTAQTAHSAPKAMAAGCNCPNHPHTTYGSFAHDAQRRTS